MASVKFEDYTLKVTEAISEAINAKLEACAGDIKSETMRNSRVVTGQTKGSFMHFVNDELHEAYIGSDYENAIWEEFGTGEYALAGNGRKGGWYYYNKAGEKVFTRGKYPTRALSKAFESLKDDIIKDLRSCLKGL